MRVILNSVYQPTIDPGNVHISRSASDPVPTCSVDIKDNTSSIQISAMQELLVLDDQQIPNPTINLLLNPTLNPYNTSWTNAAASGWTIAQNGGGGVIFTTVNALTLAIVSQASTGGSAVPGQTYVASGFFTGSAATNCQAYIEMVFQTASGGNALDVVRQFAVSNSTQRFSMSVTAPASASYITINIGAIVTSGTSSGSITLTNPQVEPQWFPTIAYPTPFCGPSQTNCVQLPSGLYIRQYRKFAGFVNHATAGNYVGNVRTWTVDAVGYAWLASLILCNNSYTNQFDSAIFTNLLSTYLPNLLTTTNVVQGVELSSVQSNWDDLRTMFDNLASQSTFYWTFDYYWGAIYAPPGYITMPISLICDNSGTPDMISTFPAYNFSAEMDFTQPGSTILVIGSGSNVAEVIDPAQSALYNSISGYSFKTGSIFMRKVNESSLQSVADCTQRGMAELLQYDYPRNIYHLTTNVELIPGEAIPVTSNTDGLNATTLLIQQVSATWLGTDETLKDVWEYQSDLGAVNRAATNILSRIFRATNSNSSAPAISATTLAVFERIGMTDGLPSAYALIVLGDLPLAYYRLGEASGTTAYDMSGNTYNGTLNGTITLSQPGAIANDTNTSMLFDGSSGFVSLPAGVAPSSACSLECWFKVSPGGFSNYPRLIANDYPQANFKGIELLIAPAADGAFGYLNIGLGGTSSTGFGFGVGTPTVGQWYHIVGTYDGTTLAAYVNGQRVGSITQTGGVLTTTNTFRLAASPVTSDKFGGYLDEPAIYNYALSSTQILNHYEKGIK